MQRANQIAEDRFRQVQAFKALLPDCSPRAAARRLGINRNTIARYVAAFDAGGVDALRPRWYRSGRRPAKRFAGILTDAVLGDVRALTVKHGSIELAWKAYARQPECPPAIAAWFRTHRRCPAELISAVGLAKREITVWTDRDTTFAVEPASQLKS